jgi:coiled-coil domain-containing protein 63/114
LKAKHEQGKEIFELEIKKLQEKLKEREEPIEFNDKSIAAMQETKVGNKKSAFANPVEILKIRLNQVTNKNAEKKKLLDQYVRNAHIIQEAFDTIQDATGITNIDEIVTTFIKAEEQNYSLFTYVDQLGQEADKLEEQNDFLDKMIDQYE